MFRKQFKHALEQLSLAKDLKDIDLFDKNQLPFFKNLLAELKTEANSLITPHHLNNIRYANYVQEQLESFRLRNMDLDDFEYMLQLRTYSFMQFPDYEMTLDQIEDVNSKIDAFHDKIKDLQEALTTLTYLRDHAVSQIVQSKSNLFRSLPKDLLNSINKFLD